MTAGLGLTGLDTDALRRLANSHGLNPDQQHAVDAELLHREQQAELDAFTARIAGADAATVHAEENLWCCLPGALAAAHRAVLAAAEDRLQAGHELVGGA